MKDTYIIEDKLLLRTYPDGYVSLILTNHLIDDVEINLNKEDREKLLIELSKTI